MPSESVLMLKYQFSLQFLHLLPCRVATASIQYCKVEITQLFLKMRSFKNYFLLTLWFVAALWFRARGSLPHNVVKFSCDPDDCMLLP